MLGVGIGEMVLIAGIALMVIGPEKFPDFAKIALRTIRDLRGYVEDIQTEVTKELKPVKREIEKLSQYNPEQYVNTLMKEPPKASPAPVASTPNAAADPTDKQDDGSGKGTSAGFDHQDNNPYGNSDSTEVSTPAMADEAGAEAAETKPESDEATAADSAFDAPEPPVERMD